MKIDSRFKKQYFRNIHKLNDVYVWNNKNQTFDVGINGTSHHFANLPKHKAESLVTCLIFQTS